MDSSRTASGKAKKLVRVWSGRRYRKNRTYSKETRAQVREFSGQEATYITASGLMVLGRTRTSLSL